MCVTEKDLDKIAHVALPLGEGNTLMRTDYIGPAPGSLTTRTNLYIIIDPESA